MTTPAKDGSNGNVITVAGELQAPTIQIAGGPADSVIQVTTGLLDAVFPWTTFSWPFANPPAGLTALPFSASPRLHCQLSNPDHAAGPADGSDTLAINGVTGSDTFLLRTNSVALLQYSNGQLQQTYERINYNTSINVLDVNGLEPDNYVYSDSARTVGQVFADSLRLLVTRTMRRRASPRKAILQHCRRRDDACHRGEPQRRQRADQQFGIERRCEL